MVIAWGKPSPEAVSLPITELLDCRIRVMRLTGVALSSPKATFIRLFQAWRTRAQSLSCRSSTAVDVQYSFKVSLIDEEALMAHNPWCSGGIFPRRVHRARNPVIESFLDQLFLASWISGS